VGKLSNQQITTAIAVVHKYAATMLAVVAVPTAIFVLSLTYFSNSVWAFVLASVCLGLVLMGLSYLIRSQYALCMVLASAGLILVCIPVVDQFLAVPKAVEAEVTPRSNEPVYSFANFSEGGGSFEAWWKLYFDTWMETHWTIFQEDPTGTLKYVPKPDTCAKFMDGEICINNLGLIGRTPTTAKGEVFRIIALGESTTMGVPLTTDYVPWPRVLERLIGEQLICNRPIEVLNAGIAGYNIADNNIRIETDLANLHPDLILSYHGYNGFHFLFEDFPEPNAALPQDIGDRPSPLLRSIEYAWRMREWYASSGGHTSLSNEGLEGTDLHRHFERLIQLSEELDFDLALLTYNLAIDENTPPEVVAFYRRVFLRGEGNIIFNNAQTQILQDLATHSDASFIDTSVGLNGGWDYDLFTDLVHFTKEGDELMAANVLQGLKELLISDPNLQCRSSQ
jgi:lysophospholipase L1-like esterase